MAFRCSPYHTASALYPVIAHFESALWEPYFPARLADVYAQQGQVEEGLATRAEALAGAEATGERWGEPELYRLRGGSLLRQAGTAQAEVETWLQRAWTSPAARRQNHRSGGPR